MDPVGGRREAGEAVPVVPAGDNPTGVVVHPEIGGTHLDHGVVCGTAAAAVSQGGQGGQSELPRIAVKQHRAVRHTESQAERYYNAHPTKPNVSQGLSGTSTTPAGSGV